MKIMKEVVEKKNKKKLMIATNEIGQSLITTDLSFAQLVKK